MPDITTKTFSLRAADICVALACALIAAAAVHGMHYMLPLGIGINTDLQNYAQILEVHRHPELFAADPAGQLFPFDPGVPNLLSILAELFPGETSAVSLLSAGGVAIFCHLLCWYLGGRILFGSPSLAIVLSLVSSITWYWSFGTYWGCAHEEPIPRLFFNALWPFLVILACKGLDRTWPRYVLCLLTGLAVCIHSVSTLMCGGMFLTVFFLLPAQGWQGWRRGSIVRHLGSTAVCVILYALPVLTFLSLRVPVETPVPGALSLFREIFAVRFGKDYSHPWSDLAGTLIQYATQAPVLTLAFVAMVFLFVRRNNLSGYSLALARLLPLMVAGIAAVTLVCALEMTLAAHFGRMHMSQEILRGTRFLIPVSLLALCCVLSLVWRRLPGWTCTVLPLLLAGTLFVASPDRMMCALRASADLLLQGETTREDVVSLVEHNRLELEALQAVERLVPRNEPIFSPDNTMSVRYVARYPLHPVHKDGNIIYYCRDYALGTQWLREQTALAAKEPLTDIWQSTETRWMLVNTRTWQDLGRNARLTPVFANRDWLLFHNNKP